MILRDYQEEAVCNTIKAFEDDGVGSALISLPTGTGKTIVFSSISKRFRPLDRVMVLAHRKELIHQAKDKLETVTGEQVDIEMGVLRADQGGIFSRCRTVVSSIQTQSKRLDKFDPMDFGLLICDECHHSVSDSWTKVIEHYKKNPDLKVVGVTATADRADEVALGEVFETVTAEYEIIEAIRDGWLVPIKCTPIELEGVDYSAISTSRGDLAEGELEEQMIAEEPLQGVADTVATEADGRKTLIFTCGVKHAEMLCDIMNRREPGMARWVCGKTPDDERKQSIDDFTAGVFTYLINVGCFTEGYDEPSIQVIAMARPTKSRGLYAQMAGRGTRTLEGVVDGLDTAKERREAIARSAKPHVEIIDFTCNTGRHKLVNSADILGGKSKDDVVKKAHELIESGEEEDAVTAIDRAEEIMEKERELARQVELASRRKLLGRAIYTTRTIDPFDALSIEPERDHGWDRVKRPSLKQEAWLNRNGVNTEGLSLKKASTIIGEIKRREDEGLCGFPQAAKLTQAGYDPDVTPAEAAVILKDVARQRREQGAMA